jgi:hypothetical protein
MCRTQLNLQSQIYLPLRYLLCVQPTLLVGLSCLQEVGHACVADVTEQACVQFHLSAALIDLRQSLGAAGF